ncbi:MAG TPA: proline--tRNA ligase [Smithella sp.]|jgi:prolyl-tRNA synthetase|nr:proline--tRNA ligase [Smithella sp.]HOG09957.1 proline--tRNA ligase [Smithella sp.]HOS14155.1 proline--tRNA ligase [Smithella sp.]HPL47456.1 proline--tRNA ligase [Smithella sp.]HPX29945.1 proline--tRNA ligase [Smithella sp.]
MRYSEMFLPTVREVPSDAEIISHQLMIRAGLIRKLTSGIYSYLPLGYRVIRKLEQIIREEMNRAGAQEVHLPMVQPAEIWQESGRWTYYGKELLRLRDRHDHEYCLGPTHEEVITGLVRNDVKTYRQLPLNLYQIQTKFRDEVRPRFGVMRCREFGMKDAYSFDVDEEGAEKSYEKMFAAYNNIFRRCGLQFRPVEADSGSIGGKYSHEFMVMADSGEDAMVFCEKCAYAANLEKAEVACPEKKIIFEDDWLPLEDVDTPDVRTIEEVSAFLKVTPQNIVKTLIFNADGKPCAVLIRGDHEVNEVKVKNYLAAAELELASDDMIREVTGAPRGFAGPVNIKAPILVDYSVIDMVNFVTGGNRQDGHLKNVNVGRDFKVEAFTDLRIVNAGDPCPRCGQPIKTARGIEVGHVFKLGTKYSKAMKAVYLGKDGQEKIMIMGCYGIGIGRTVAAGIEQNHDDNGIIWPMPLAPYQVIITPVNINEITIRETAEYLYNAMITEGVEVLYDDRDERAGVKFKDADLIGIPLRVTVGHKNLQDGNVELKIRKTGANELCPLQDIVGRVREIIRQELNPDIA